MPVVLVVLDAFPNRLVDPERTPNLWRLASEGGRNVDGGISELTAATYPNHATAITGSTTAEHGIVTNQVLSDGEWIMSSRTGPATPTLFDRCRAAGRTSAAVVGDYELIGVCGARVADVHWPPNGVVPDGVERGVGGYIADHEVVAAASRMNLSEADFVFAQIDEVDGVRHQFGAWSDDAHERCHLTDAALGRFLETFADCWSSTAVLVMSDHDQEDVSSAPPVDLGHHLPPGVEHQNQGTAAQVVGEIEESALLEIGGINGVHRIDATRLVVWGDEGQYFSSSAPTVTADHGSPRTSTQVAVVGGGHPGVADIAERLQTVRPPATAWAGWAAELLAL